jgi:hypothetical protein
MNGAKGGKVRRTPMTKAERALKQAEKLEQSIQRLKELVEEPPSRLDQLLKTLGRAPTLEQHVREGAKSLLPAYERFLQAMKDKGSDPET